MKDVEHLKISGLIASKRYVCAPKIEKQKGPILTRWCMWSALGFIMLRWMAGDALAARATANRSRHIVTQHHIGNVHTASSKKIPNQLLAPTNTEPRRVISGRTGHATQDPATGTLSFADMSVSATHEELSNAA